MDINRRSIVSAAPALAASLASISSARATEAAGTAGAPAAALRAYVEMHRRKFGLPGVTLVAIDAKRGTIFQNLGYADTGEGRAVRSQDLFQIGSISKSITALCIFRLLQAGRLRLDDDVRDHARGLRIDTVERVTLQQLLNHSSGLPVLAPLAPPPTGSLWLGYKPGSHWSYSDTGYDLLTAVVEACSGVTLEQMISKEIFPPLGVTGARAAIRKQDRALYATGYYPARLDVPLPTAPALVSAPFDEVTSGSGCVGMSSAQMASYLRWLIGAGRGRGGQLLSDEMATRWVRPTVEAPGWGKDARYANGLAVVKVDGRTLLHHTGGMLGFVSSLHVDPEAGVACFASANTSWLTDYRPRDITSYACALLRTSASGAPAPTPPSIEDLVEKPDDYAGVFQNGKGERIEFRVAAKMLELHFAGGVSTLEPAGDGAFLAHHPAFERYCFLFERRAGRPFAVWWGDVEYAADPSKLRGPAPEPLRLLAGRYDGPVTPTRIVARPTGLFYDGLLPLIHSADGTWRPSGESWTPERISFDTPLNGQPQRMILSGVVSWRTSERV